MNRFVDLLHAPGASVILACHDPLSARVAEVAGFDALTLSGYDLGATLLVTEPLLTETEVTAAATAITRTVDLPLLVDVGAGFGEPLHVSRTIRNMVAARVDAVQLDDQIFPKRAHYFADYTEHIVPRDEMAAKIEWARRAADGRIAIVARTDAYATDGEDEALARCRLFLEAGADAVMAFPRSAEEATRLPASVDGPVVYVNTHGNRVGRPSLSTAQAAAMGYGMLLEPHVLLFAAFAAMEEHAAALRAGGGVERHEELRGVRARIEEVLGVRELLAIEEETVER